MNNKSNKLIILFFAFLFVIFLLINFIKEFKPTESDITNMNIINYIPSNYEFTILSNATNNNINEYLNKNMSEKKKYELNMIKDSIISYLGFDLRGKIKDIYDNELAISFFRNKLNEKDILLIFKLKKNKEIDDIINLGEELNITDHIIELKRLGKLNYISHIFLTQDNYVIASSNKKLINSSLQPNKDNQIISNNSIPDNINLKEIKLLSISKYKLNPESPIFNKLITIINSEDDKIKLRLFSQNIDKINTKIRKNKTDNIKDIIFTNKYSKYRQNINYLYNNINQKEFLEEISKEVNNELLFITNNNNWVVCFKSKLPNKISIDQLNFLKKFKKEEIDINDKIYSVYTNDRLKIKDNNIIDEEEIPIFSLQDDVNTYISNNFDTLLNIYEQTTLIDQYLNNNDNKSSKYILNDLLFIKNINNKQLFEYFSSIKNLQYFISNKLFSLQDININISQTVPERNEKIYLESNLKIL